ncbi:MAG: UDP-N-acetylmuramate--L-alanine ligase [Sedimentisphaerales bacterium]|nr:UDP-N-acetylmuramate--L-alanine ligase [Sedimentisphaerales bacterium]
MRIQEVSSQAVSSGPTLLSLRNQAMQVKQHYHFVGIGGCGMSGLAQVLARRGQIVSGSDQQASAVTAKLRDLGIDVQIGHRPENLPDAIRFVVASAAVAPDNPELEGARRRGIRIFKYAELLGEISQNMHTLAIAGTHGKSTSSGWLAYTLALAGCRPNFVIGAQVDQLGGGSGAEGGEFLVVEACEFDRSFLHLHPRAAAILNIERDHLDYYRDLDEIVEAFAAFGRQVAADGLIVANGSDPQVRRLLEAMVPACQTFALDGAADWQALELGFEQGQGRFELAYRGESLGRVRLALAGRHNVANALATAALANHAGLSGQQIRAGLETYTGAQRRMTRRGSVNGVVILDDYAHHPTEIRVTLEAIAAHYQPRRLWCVFQPHQHSRTRFLLQEFAGSFAAADVVLLPDIYFVRDSETSRRQVNAAMLAERIAAQGQQALYLGDFSRIAEFLIASVQPGDVVVTMGAGDVWKLADELICRLGRDR